MKTDDLIALLAKDATPIDRGAPARRFSLALLLGLASATLLMVLLLGVRPDLAQAMRMPMFWARLAFATAIASGALLLTLRLSRPGMPVGAGWAALSAPIAVAWVGTALILLDAPAEARAPLLLGHTWKVCSTLIATLSLPSFAAMLWAVRGMAPVRLRLAGAAAGLLAGGTAAMAYCLHCPEMAPPFWSTWYVLGMLVPAGIGMVIGPRVLRW